ncbi:MAG: PfkB family carbohydrate kinase, partial [Pseudomonadota bacterium]
PVEKVVDSTAAGDSFNAGYLAARFAGLGCVEAAEQGNKLAATVVQYPGAIIPRTKMPF